jgi:DNA-binding NarL/FixJ family response regulator
LLIVWVVKVFDAQTAEEPDGPLHTVTMTDDDGLVRRLLREHALWLRVAPSLPRKTDRRIRAMIANGMQLPPGWAPHAAAAAAQPCVVIRSR